MVGTVHWQYLGSHQVITAKEFQSSKETRSILMGTTTGQRNSMKAIQLYKVYVSLLSFN